MRMTYNNEIIEKNSLFSSSTKPVDGNCSISCFFFLQRIVSLCLKSSSTTSFRGLFKFVGLLDGPYPRTHQRVCVDMCLNGEHLEVPVCLSSLT